MEFLQLGMHTGTGKAGKEFKRVAGKQKMYKATGTL